MTDRCKSTDTNYFGWKNSTKKEEEEEDFRNIDWLFTAISR